MSSATVSKQECIQNCQECQVILSDMLTQTCLVQGGEHVEQTHVKLMLDCIAACNACVSFMSRNSDFHGQYCKACAEICSDCADSCQQVGNMKNCVDSCRKCSQSCDSMAA